MTRARAIPPLVVALAAAAASAQPVNEPRAQVRAWLADGDPRVAPITVDSLREVWARPLHDSTNRYYLTGLFGRAAKFRLDEAGPMMAAFARRPDLSATDLERTAYAAAAYESPAARPLQRALLADARLTEERPRVALLAALAEDGDAAAADALAAWSLEELKRAEAADVVHDALWMSVPRTRSAALLDRVRAWPAPATPRGREMLAKITARLEAAQRPADALLAFVEQATPDQEMRVVDALSILGRIGTPAHRERLANVWLGEGPHPLCGLAWAEAVRRDAIIAIRQRCWREELPFATRDTR